MVGRAGGRRTRELGETSLSLLEWVGKGRRRAEGKQRAGVVVER